MAIAVPGLACIVFAVIQRLETRDSTIVGRTESVPACIAAFGQLLSASTTGDSAKVYVRHQGDSLTARIFQFYCRDDAVADLGRNLVVLETVVLRLQGELSRCEKEKSDISEVQAAMGEQNAALCNTGAA